MKNQRTWLSGRLWIFIFTSTSRVSFNPFGQAPDVKHRLMQRTYRLPSENWLSALFALFHHTPPSRTRRFGRVFSIRQRRKGGEKDTSWFWAWTVLASFSR